MNHYKNLPACAVIIRQQNLISRHPRLSGIGRLNTPKTKKDSGQAGMTIFEYLITCLVIIASDAYDVQNAEGVNDE
jgi:hypothetical protein